MYPKDTFGINSFTPSTKPRPALNTEIATELFSISDPFVLINGVSTSFTLRDRCFVDSTANR